MATGSGGEIWEKGSNVTIAMDDSGFSEFAFDCRFDSFVFLRYM